MGARMAARGHVDISYSVPYFIDPGNFEPRFTEPDSFLAADNLRRLLDGETGKREMHIKDRLILTLPQSHTISVDLLPGKLSLSYSKVFGRVSIHTESKDATGGEGKENGDAGSGGASRSGAVGGQGNAADTTSGKDDAGRFVDLDLFPDQVLCLSGKFGWFHGDIGLHSLNISYRDQGHMLSGLSPIEWDGDPLVPILDFGFTWGSPLVFSTDFFVSPLPAVRSGVSYAF
jgi:hypothetical protein